jgi:hypothetical protein
MEPLLQAYFSNKRFVSVCPACKQASEFTPEAFPRTPKPSVRFECPCGKIFTVVPVGLRSCYRKPVNLGGGLRKKTEVGLIQAPCTVHDISPRGLLVSTELLKSVVVNDTIQMTVVLDDKDRSKLVLDCLVRRKIVEERTMTLGLEIVPPIGPHTDLLTRYTTGDSSNGFRLG